MSGSLSIEQEEKIIVPSRTLGLIKDTEGQESRSNIYNPYYNKTGEDVRSISQKKSKNSHKKLEN